MERGAVTAAVTAVAAVAPIAAVTAFTVSFGGRATAAPEGKTKTKYISSRFNAVFEKKFLRVSALPVSIPSLPVRGGM